MKTVLFVPRDSGKTSVFTTQYGAPFNAQESDMPHLGEHLGLGYVASSLKRDGHDVDLLYQCHDSNEQFARRILAHHPEVVMGTSLTCSFNNANKIFETIKRESPNTRTVIGGDHISGHPQSLGVSPSIDYGVIGEGEVSSRDIMQGANFTAEASNLVSSGRQVIIPRSPIRTLDDLAFPLRTQESISQTAISGIFEPSVSQLRPMGIFYSSRGCPYSCSNCSSKNTLTTGGVRFRSIPNVIDEIKEVKDEFGIKSMMFYDLTFNANKDHVENLCNGLIENNINLNWASMCRLTTPSGKPMIDKELAGLMFKAGCRKIYFGIESFDNDISGDYQKQGNSETYMDTLRVVDDAGIINRALLMLSHKDSPQTIRKNLEGLCKFPIHEIRISFLTPFPGTPFYDECVQNSLLLSHNWDDFSGELPIVKSEHYTPQGLLDAREQLFTSFMGSATYKDRLREKARKNPWFSEGIAEYTKALSAKFNI